MHPLSSRLLPHFHSFSKRKISVKQVLRPFFFEVHPDRFAEEPQIQEKNEKALQVIQLSISYFFYHLLDIQRFHQ